MMLNLVFRNVARSIVRRHDTMQADVLVAVRGGWKKDGAVLVRETARLRVMEMRMRRFEGRRMRKTQARNTRAAEEIWTNEMRRVAQNAARRAALPALVFFFKIFKSARFCTFLHVSARFYNVTLNLSEDVYTGLQFLTG